MKIAIVGTGISGLMAAYLLNPIHDIQVFDSADWIGGHSHTIPVKEPNGTTIWVDTGFIVFNHRNYPHLTRLFKELGVETQASEMSFSVQCEASGLYYQGSSLNGFFAQRKQLLNPAFYRFFWEFYRFKQLALPYIQGALPGDVPLSHFLKQSGFSTFFVQKYLLPMLSAIWSAPLSQIEQAELGFLLRFLDNHGMLGIQGRPAWRTVKGGSVAYVNKLTAAFSDKIQLSHTVKQIRPVQAGVILQIATPGGQIEAQFDKVIVAAHADQALDLLAAPSPLQVHLLKQFPYQENEVILHQDTRCIPPVNRARAAWNYWIPKGREDLAMVTYDMNRLQSLHTTQPYLVSLNSANKIDPKHIIGRYRYAHPVFNEKVLAYQAQFDELNQPDASILFAGAYWGNGFHEDGLYAGIRVAKKWGGQWD